jgi:hypothetical protein
MLILQYSNKFFIERDPKHFATLVNFLREGKVNKKIKAKDMEELRDEFAFYNIPFPELEAHENEIPQKIKTEKAEITVYVRNSPLPHCFHSPNPSFPSPPLTPSFSLPSPR